MTRQEGDIIREVMKEYERQGIDAIYALDSSEDDTLGIIRESPIVRYAATDREAGVDRSTIADGARQLLFERAVQEHGWDNWFFSLAGDEIYHCSIREVAARTDPSQYRLLYTLGCTFLLHGSEAATIDQEDPVISIQERRRWHFFFRQEPRAFHGEAGMAFDAKEKRRNYPHWQGDSERAGQPDVKYGISPHMLFVKNYPARSPEQWRWRIADRRDRDWAPPYAPFLPGLYIHHLKDVWQNWYNPDVFYSPLQRLEEDGRFHLYVRHDGLWDRIPGSETFRGTPLPEPEAPS